MRYLISLTFTIFALNVHAEPLIQRSCSGPLLQIIDRSTSDEVQSRWQDNVMDPGSRRGLVQQIVSDLPPLQQAAVRRVAFIDRSSGSNTYVTGWSPTNSHQDLIYLNGSLYSESNLANSPAAMVEMQHTLVHEATHAAAKLLHSITDADVPGIFVFQPDSTLWPEDCRRFAREILNSTRIKGGLLQEWTRMHEALEEVGLTADYYGDDWQETQASQAADDGFMSPYGGENEMEDMSEFASWAETGHHFNGVPQATREDFACSRMGGYSGSAIPSEFAAAMTKLGFLLDLQMISQSGYNRCIASVGSHQLNEEPVSSAIQVVTGEPRTARKVLSDEVASWMGRREPSGNRYFYQMDAQGQYRIGSDEQGWDETPVHASIMIDLHPASDDDVDDVSWPRGIYQLHPITPDGGSTRFILEFEEAGNETFWASSGWILITRASNRLIRGSVVVQDGIRPMGGFEIDNTSLFHATYYFAMKK